MAYPRYAPNTASERPRAETGPVYAALDLGTNNCRLLIARPVEEMGRKNNGIRALDSFSRIVRLGEDVGVGGVLTEAAQDRTIKALQICKRKIERFDLTAGRYVTTEACRQAKNSRDFLARVEAEVGLELEVVSTEEEAILAFRGCANLLMPAPKYALVFDIGGGSTEVLWVETDHSAQRGILPEHKVLDWFSMDRGVMNLLDGFGDRVAAEGYYEELVGQTMRRLGDFNSRNGIADAVARGEVQMLSTSGTVTTLAAIYLDLQRYDRSRIDGLELSQKELAAAVKKVREMRVSERFMHPCIGADRSDYIVSGCALFEAVVRLWPVSSMTIADRGVREGIVLSLMAQTAK
jgi:exopolyphosphatase/guanosine-5'-triphosphate,3'-diphosphate pyrophosphatase